MWDCYNKKKKNIESLLCSPKRHIYVETIKYFLFFQVKEVQKNGILCEI